MEVGTNLDKNETIIDLSLQIYAERLRPIVCDTVEYVNKALQDKNMNIVVEGANATMLDIDFGK